MITIRYSQIRRIDISNGPGIRVSIFTQGCDIFCKNCFNSDIWDYSGGEEWTDDIKNEVLDLCNRDEVSGLSILGGEPLSLQNYDSLTTLIVDFKKLFPNKSVWLWTGRVFEDLDENQMNIVKLVDVLVDGPFKTNLHDFSLKYRGSSNQRVIDVKKTIQNNSVVEIFKSRVKYI